MLGNTVRILVGLPGAGKTTFAEKLNNNEGHYHIFDFDKKTVVEIEKEFKVHFKPPKSQWDEFDNCVIDECTR